MALVEAGVPVDAAVQPFCLGQVLLLDGSQAAPLPEGVQHVSQEVDGEAGRRVVQAVFFGVDPVLQHLGEGFAAAVQHVVADQGQHQARGPEVLLGPRVDEPEGAHVEGTPHHVRGHVAGQGDASGFGESVPLGSIDRVVAAEVDVLGVGVHLDPGGGGEPIERGVLGGRDHAGCLPRHGHGFHVCPSGPVPRHHVIRLPSPVQQVHGQHAELEVAAALQEQDLEVLGHVQQLADQRDGLVVDGIVFGGSVADFHYGHARALEVQQFVPGPFEGLHGQCRRTGREVDEALGHGFLPRSFR